ncbi:MAG: WXG100 family type VII secretion target [Bifidobacteriaceae bacterium]|nr:WXG100 family type VII secretion target [Bifidobacteriaceae bacterium]
MSSDQSMSVSTGQVTGLADSLRARANAILSVLEELESRVGVLQGSWDGKAKEAYQVAQKQWTEQAHRLQELAAKIATMTSDVADGYAQMDARAASQF